MRTRIVFSPAAPAALLCLWATLLAPSVWAQTYTGYLDGADCWSIGGWAWDGNDQDKLNIYLYNGATLLTTVTANQLRSDLVGPVGSGYHAYGMNTPDSLRDNQPHTIHAYYSNGQELTYSPRTFSCAYNGYLDGVTPLVINGWGWKVNSNNRMPINLYDGNQLAIQTTANQYRSDLYSGGVGDGYHGFSAPPTATMNNGQDHYIYARIADQGTLIDLEYSPRLLHTSPTPVYAGYFDVASCDFLAGWALDENHPTNRLTVGFYDGSTLVTTTTANLFRQDLLDAQLGDGAYAFYIATPASLKDGATHQISAQAGFVLTGGTKALTCAPPTVQLSDLTQSSSLYFVGDSFSLTVNGPPSQAVTVIQNGVSSNVLGYTNSSGVYSASGVWAMGDVGSFAQIWLTGGIPATPTLVFSVLPPPGTPGGPASQPGSYTAVLPAPTCNDITGNWIATPSSGPQSEWDLTQTGNTVTGNVYVSKSSQCGVVTYTVSSSHTPGANFVLTATGPNPSTDNCGNVSPTSDTHTVTLSGGSCSQASGTWQSPAGTGNVSWQSKTAPNNVTPTSTTTTAHYNISYAAYIPVDNIPGPTSCAFDVGPQVLGVPLLYRGDAFRGTYRTTQSVVVIPDARRDYGFFFNAGPTRNYGAGSPANGLTLDSNPQSSDIYMGPYSGADEDGSQYDCRWWNDRGKADLSNMGAYTVSYPYSTQAQVHLFGSGQDPLEPKLGGIAWDMNVVVDDSAPGAATAIVSFNHTCYPAHIVKVNGTVVYHYQPPQNNTAYLGACLLQLPFFGKVVGQQSTAVSVPSQ